jgi:virginiamycin B lyase
MASTKRRLGLGAASGALALAAAYAFVTGDPVSAQEQTLLSGRVVSAEGQPVAGIPIKAKRDNVTVAVYTNRNGEYSFPGWSDLTPGSYAVSIELPDFEHQRRDGVAIAAGRATKVDFTIKSKPVAYEDATASEIIAALPGTDHQKVLFAQCSNCHTLQWALKAPKTKDEWAATIRRMAGRAANEHTPDTYAYGQKQYVEPLAEYLAQIRGPGSSDSIPFKPRPRPTDEASTNLVITEYDVPRGGVRELYMLRGDRRHVWPHDVVVDANYAYYTDHFSNAFGRVDRKTGKAEELRYELPQGAGRDENGGDGRAGNPGGGSHDLLIDKQGRILIGMDDATVRYDPKTEKFQTWGSGQAMFGLDPDGNVWHHEERGPVVKLNTSTGQVSNYPVPESDGIYDMDSDSKGRFVINIWRNNKIGVFDPRNEKYAEYKLPTPQAGPRRGEIDAQDRLWVTEFYASQVAMFDPNTGAIKEYPLFPGQKPFTAPYAQPYSLSVDNKNQVVWTNDFLANRLHSIDIRTGKTTEYFTPTNYELRDLTVEENAPRPTIWLPHYRPPAKIVKVQVR